MIFSSTFPLVIKTSKTIRSRKFIPFCEPPHVKNSCYQKKYIYNIKKMLRWALVQFEWKYGNMSYLFQVLRLISITFQLMYTFFLITAFFKVTILSATVTICHWNVILFSTFFFVLLSQSLALYFFFLIHFMIIIKKS